VGEFEGVADEIHHDLAQASRIAAEQLGHAGIAAGNQFDAFDSALQCQRRTGFVQRSPYIEADVFQIEMAGFDLGKIQDIVDEREQGGGAPLDDVDVLRLGAVQRRFGQ
jgi:hypothetical protein